MWVRSLVSAFGLKKGKKYEVVYDHKYVFTIYLFEDIRRTYPRKYFELVLENEEGEVV